ncbi:MAG: hypothetical protein IH866_01545 [Chloroflexi bacterium]|nr:hypothetical protein [Chloroflexota bacterium]
MADQPIAARTDDGPANLGRLPQVTQAFVRISPGLALLTAAGAIFFVHLPVLSHYFFGDDFVPLADIASRSTPRYIADLFLLRDETPNWRFLTGLFYLATYKAFGLNAFPFLLVSVLVHIGTAGLIFALLRRIMNAVWPAFLAAVFFGLTSAAVPTVGQVTAFNNVLGGFLLMLSIALLYEGLDRERLRYWGAASVVSFAAAIAANESVAVLAPVPPLLALWHVAQKDDWWRERAALRTLALVSAPYAVIGGAALLALGACGCTSAAGGATYGVGGHMIDNLWIFLGRLLYPVGMEPLGEPGLAHLVAGLALAGVSVAALVRGPGLARFAVVFLLLALLPYLPLKLWSAPRYVYLASIPFSLLAAVVFSEAAQYGRRLTPVIPGMLALVAFGVLGLYGWQTWNQNQVIAGGSVQWQSMVVGLQTRYPELPEGSIVYVHGGPLTNSLLQCHVLPALGELLWDDVRLFTFYTTYLVGHRLRPGYDIYVAEYAGGRIVPITIRKAKPDEMNDRLVVLLPPVTSAGIDEGCLSGAGNA